MAEDPNKEYKDSLGKRVQKAIGDTYRENVPLKVRSYIKQYAPGGEWNEEMLTPDEHDVAKRIAADVVNYGSKDYNHKGSRYEVGYKDYNEAGIGSVHLGNEKRREKSDLSKVDPNSEQLKHLLGSSRIVADDKGVLYFADQYDFDPISDRSKEAQDKGTLEKARAVNDILYDYNIEKMADKGKTLDPNVSGYQKFGTNAGAIVSSLADMAFNGGKGPFDEAHTIAELFGRQGSKKEGAPGRYRLGTAEELGINPKYIGQLPTLAEYNRATGVRDDYRGRNIEGDTKAQGFWSTDKVPASVYIQEDVDPNVAPNELPRATLRNKSEATSPKEAVKESIPAPKESPPPAKVPETSEVSEPYTIQRGDSLSKIAAKYGTTVQALREANNIGKDGMIYVGRTLNLGKSSPRKEVDAEPPKRGTQERPQEKPSSYQIQKGDSLSKIAAKYGTTVKALREANGIKDADKIYVGRSLKL